MNSNKAKRLLEIELIRQARKLSSDEAAELRELIEVLFYKSYETKRKSFRIQVHKKGQIQIQDRLVDCDIYEMSHTGLSLQISTDVSIQLNDIVSLNLVSVGTKKIKTQIRYKVVSLPNEANKNIGLMIENNHSLDERKTFFEEIYYPLYMCYIENLAHAKSSDNAQSERLKIVK